MWVCLSRFSAKSIPEIISLMLNYTISDYFLADIHTVRSYIYFLMHSYYT